MKLFYLNYMPSFMNKDGSNFSKPGFGYFRQNFVNLKRLMILF